MLKRLFRRVVSRSAEPVNGLRELATIPEFQQYKIGRGTYGRPRVLSWGEGATLKIGSFTSIAEGVEILLGGEHRPDWVTTYPFNELWDCARGHKGHPMTRGDVVIGSDVWIGRGALIRSGVQIGDGAVIGARSVVTRSVTPYTVVAGNPAREVRLRFSPRVIEALLEIRWWDWPDECIVEAMPLLLSDDLDGFVRTYRRADQGVCE